MARPSPGPARRYPGGEHSPAPTPSRAVYGFVLYLMSYSAMGLYLTWAVLPDHILAQMGLLEFLPQKYWAVALPIYLSVVFLCFVVVIYPSLGMMHTLPETDIRNVTDGAAIYFPNKTLPGAVPPVQDIHPIDLARAIRNKDRLYF